jgi:hypothetical protein
MTISECIKKIAIDYRFDKLKNKQTIGIQKCHMMQIKINR